MERLHLPSLNAAKNSAAHGLFVTLTQLHLMRQTTLYHFPRPFPFPFSISCFSRRPHQGNFLTAGPHAVIRASTAQIYYIYHTYTYMIFHVKITSCLAFFFVFIASVGCPIQLLNNLSACWNERSTCYTASILFS